MKNVQLLVRGIKLEKSKNFSLLKYKTKCTHPLDERVFTHTPHSTLYSSVAYAVKIIEFYSGTLSIASIIAFSSCGSRLLLLYVRDFPDISGNFGIFPDCRVNL